MSAWLGISGPSAGERPLPGSSIVAGPTGAFAAVNRWNLPFLLFELLQLVFQIPFASYKDVERKGLERLAELTRWQLRRLFSMLELVWPPQRPFPFLPVLWLRVPSSQLLLCPRLLFWFALLFICLLVHVRVISLLPLLSCVSQPALFRV